MASWLRGGALWVILGVGAGVGSRCAALKLSWAIHAVLTLELSSDVPAGFVVGHSVECVYTCCHGRLRNTTSPSPFLAESAPVRISAWYPYLPAVVFMRGPSRGGDAPWFLDSGNIPLAWSGHTGGSFFSEHGVVLSGGPFLLDADVDKSEPCGVGFSGHVVSHPAGAI